MSAHLVRHRAARRGWLLAVLLVLAVIPSLAPGSAQGTPEVEGSFSAPDAVAVSGHLSLSSTYPGSPGSPGALAVPQLAAADAFELTGREITVHVAWERGVDLGPRDSPAEVKRVEESGERTLRFTNASVSLDDLAPAAQLLAFNRTGGAYSLTLSSTAPGTLQAAPGQELAGAGSSPHNAAMGELETAGFWYHTGHDWAGAGLSGARASAAGDFGLFLNNLTLTVEGDQGSWTNWTGYRDQSTTTLDRTYEHRIVVLDVKGANLTVSSGRGLALYGPRLTGTFDGTLDVERAWGSLVTSDEVVALEAHRLSMTGTGSLILGVGDDVPPRVPSLRVAPSGDFTVSSPAPRLPVGEGGGLGLETRIPVVWALLGVVVLAVGAVVGGPQAYRALLEVGGRRRERRREHRAEEAIADGLALEAGAMFHAAAVEYRRAVELVPDRPYARYLRARALIDAGDYTEALRELDEASEALPVQPLDLLELRVAAAWYAGESEHAVGALAQLYRVSASMATSLVEDLGVPELARGLYLRSRSNGGAGRKVAPGRWEGIDGYA